MKKIAFQNLIFDGGLGTMLQARGGMQAGYPSEQYNLDNPDLVTAIHREYAEAGADVICTNSFGINPIKYRTRYQSLLTAAIRNAKKAGARYVALDVGPLGKIVGPDGISFDTAVEQFKKIVKAANDQTDFIFIETMTSLAEVRAAILAAKECSKLPVVASMSFEKNGRTFFGTSAECFAVTVEGMGVSAIGTNCSVGPVEAYDIAKRLLSATSLPVVIKPNAGIPRIVDGRSVYECSPEDFSVAMTDIAKLGVSMLGGCCGTTPEHIKAIAPLKTSSYARAPYKYKTRVCSATTVASFEDFQVIGERINPTGKKKLKQALIEQDYEHILSIAVEQLEQGADILDVNCGLSEIDETATMLKLIDTLQNVVNAPLQIDTSNPKTLEAALRRYNGKAIVNSVNGEESNLSSILPIVAKYGAAVVGLTLDEHGIPATTAERLKIAKTIISAAKKAGIKAEDVLIDALTLSEASEKGKAVTTLDTVARLNAYGVKTVLGVSNVSFGMPNREDINARFLTLAKANGLSAAIMNPKMLGLEGSKEAEAFLKAEENSVDNYLAFASNAVPAKRDTAALTLKDAIVTGQRDLASSLAKEALKRVSNPMELASSEIIPALNEVGKQYECGRFFLPQLIAAADAAKDTLAVIEAASGSSAQVKRNRFLIATVKGDIHDIGKNIVKSVVSNYGFKVIDLGRDVSTDKILTALADEYPCVLGLSALMTTTAANMEATIKAIRTVYPNIPVLVGGAVLTEVYAAKIGGTYCKDAADTVKQLQRIFKD